MTGPSSIRTLIVEDDASVCAMHVRYVDGLVGFTVVGTASTGAEALAFAADAEVDLILLDMHLPDFSGIEVLHRLRSTSDDAAVIVVTSANEAVTVRQAAAAQVADYLVKPFSRSVFELRLAAFRNARGVAAASRGTRALRQAEIDGLLLPRSPGERPRGAGVGAARSPATTGPVLPKGLAAPTVDLVLRALRSREVSSAIDVAEACGMARGTARRYLEFLRLSGQAIVTHRYGVRGRPELLYSVAPG